MVKLEVETRNLDEVRQALDAGADIIMLDNMDCPSMAEAVRTVSYTHLDVYKRQPIHKSCPPAAWTAACGSDGTARSGISKPISPKTGLRLSLIHI